MTFGYIGNISNIEGIIDLCKVFQELENENILNERVIYYSDKFKDKVPGINKSQASLYL